MNLRAAVAGFAALASGGCGADEGRPAVASDLRGRLYVAVDAKSRKLVRDREASVTVGDGVLIASGGCNPDGTVAFTLDDNSLKILPYFSSDQTGTGCRKEIEDQDVWLYAFLRSRPSVRVCNGGETLILRTAEDTVTFESRARPEGRRAVPRQELDKYYTYIEQLTSGTEAKLARTDQQVEAGKLTRRQGREKNKQITDEWRRRSLTAGAKMRASAR